jgi:dethiobiotin synthetase
LLAAWAELGVEAIGLKPIETGVLSDSVEPTDQARLSEAGRSFHVKRGTGSTFHVKRSLYAWPDPVSPHLAARRAGEDIDLKSVRQWIETQDAAVTVIETAGGLFSPLGRHMTNIDLTMALEPTAVLLIAPDRLGVLHDLTATLGLATSRGLPTPAIVLSAPNQPDASTGCNAAELSLLGIAEPLAVFPRAKTSAPESRTAATKVVRWFDTKRP